MFSTHLSKHHGAQWLDFGVVYLFSENLSNRLAEWPYHAAFAPARTTHCLSHQKDTLKLHLFVASTFAAAAQFSALWSPLRFGRHLNSSLPNSYPLEMRRKLSLFLLYFFLKAEGFKHFVTRDLFSILSLQRKYTVDASYIKLVIMRLICLLWVDVIGPPVFPNLFPT